MKHIVKTIPKEEILANRSNAYEFIDIYKMKNLHVLPTDNKPSRLYFNVNDKEFQICEIEKTSTILKPNRHIYITSDEEIKEGDWFLDNNNSIGQSYKLSHVQFANPKKIILTTDFDKQPRVQAIDDEFLEWFVKNPSCEEVEVKKEYNCPVMNKTYDEPYISYKIIIPKEEPKQETLEEAAEKHLQKWRLLNNIHLSNVLHAERCKNDFIQGAKWQQEKDKDFYFKYIKSEMDFQKLRIAKLGISTTNQIFEQQVTSLIHLAERSCSEEELKSAFKIGFNIGYGSPVNGLDSKDETCDVWFEQFKKK